MRSRVLPIADEELNEAARWYQDKQKGLGLELLAEFIDAVIEIERHPRRWPVVSDQSDQREIRRYRLKRFPYALGYEVLDSEIVILAFYHGARRPKYWVHRPA